MFCYLASYDWQLSSPEEDVGVSGWSGAEDLTGEVVALLSQEIKTFPHQLGSHWTNWKKNICLLPLTTLDSTGYR